MNNQNIIVLIIAITLIILIYLIYKNKFSHDFVKQTPEKYLTSAQKNLVKLLSTWFPGMSRNAIISTVIKNGPIPKYTFPIKGLCEDGELVSDVLNRLKIEGNQDKLKYFKNYMNI